MEFTVDIDNVRLLEESQVESGEYNVTECNFTFSVEYESLTKKAVFTGEDGIAYLETIVDNKCSIPSEILVISQKIEVGVYAYDVDGNDLVLRYSPRPTRFFIYQGSYKEAQNSTPPTPTEIEQLQAQITANANDIDTLEEMKADKTEIPTKTSDLINNSNFVSDANYVHTDNNFTDEDKSQITQNANDITTLQSTKADKTDLNNYTKTSDLATVALSGSYNDLSNKPDLSGFITKDVNNLTYYTLKTNTGSLIDLEINGTTYVITLSLKDVDGNVISTDTIDLPLESVVVGGSYDSVNKKIVLTLENGNTVDIPVGDLIAGLQTEITSQNKLASDLVDDTNSGNKFVTASEKQIWNAKYDKPSGGIPSTDMSSEVQTSLGKADTAIQSTDYASASKGGTVRLGNGFTINAGGQATCNRRTYAQYESADDYYFIGKGTLENVITGKNLETANNKVTSLSSESTDTQYPTAKCVYDLVGDIETILTTLDIRRWNKWIVYGKKQL